MPTDANPVALEENFSSPAVTRPLLTAMTEASRLSAPLFYMCHAPAVQTHERQAVMASARSAALGRSTLACSGYGKSARGVVLADVSRGDARSRMAPRILS